MVLWEYVEFYQDVHFPSFTVLFDKLQEGLCLIFWIFASPGVSFQQTCIHFLSPLPMTDIIHRSESCSAQYSKYSLLIVCCHCGRYSEFTIMVKWHFDERRVVLPVAGRLAHSAVTTSLWVYSQFCAAVGAWPCSWEKAGKNFKLVM